MKASHRAPTHRRLICSAIVLFVLVAARRSACATPAPAHSPATSASAAPPAVADAPVAPPAPSAATALVARDARAPAAAILKGQIVCSGCWFEADRKVVPYGSEADLECWDRCAKKDIPTALAVTEGGETTLYILEKGAVPRDGRGWRPYVGKMVEVAGRIESKSDRPDGKLVLRADALTVVDPSAGPPASQAAPAALQGGSAAPPRDSMTPFLWFMVICAVVVVPLVIFESWRQRRKYGLSGRGSTGVNLMRAGMLETQALLEPGRKVEILMQEKKEDAVFRLRLPGDPSEPPKPDLE